jgi:hypothetical protein
MNHSTSNPTDDRSSKRTGNHSEPVRRPGRLAQALAAGALVLGGTAAALTSAGSAAARYPTPTDAEVRQNELGWALSAHFPNVRAWPESFGPLAFPNRCVYLSVVVCP